MKLARGLLFVLVAASCKHEPTVEDAREACHRFERAACTRITTCTSPFAPPPDAGADPAAAIDDCIAENQRTGVTCDNRVIADSCAAAQAEAFDDCAHRVSASSCGNLCGGSTGFCFIPCLFVCPP